MQGRRRKLANAAAVQGWMGRTVGSLRSVNVDVDTELDLRLGRCPMCVCLRLREQLWIVLSVLGD